MPPRGFFLRRPGHNGGLRQEGVELQQDLPVDGPVEVVHAQVAVHHPDVAEALDDVRGDVAPKLGRAARPRAIQLDARQQRRHVAGVRDGPAALLNIILKERKLEYVACAGPGQTLHVERDSLQHGGLHRRHDEHTERALRGGVLALGLLGDLRLVGRPRGLEGLGELVAGDPAHDVGQVLVRAGVRGAQLRALVQERGARPVHLQQRGALRRLLAGWGRNRCGGGGCGGPRCQERNTSWHANEHGRVRVEGVYRSIHL
mmetsp:Transcript_81969/g.229957  ORF Transcript_81969/g.229957 Transcript_81969/m.229957 type:complete len:259 (-) Transcript_81969:41-817(-)